MKSRPVIGLTMGDPAGIGPELCLRALREPSVFENCTPVLFGDVGILNRLSAPGIPAVNCPVLSVATWNEGKLIKEPTIVDCNALDATSVIAGTVSAECGKAAFTYIETAIQAALDGRIAGVATAPIHKEAIRLAGISHPGHTEIFTALTRARRSCMLLHSDALNVSMVTTHIGYSDVPTKISTARILDVIELTAEAMQCMLGRSPRLAICGLNPHAGESGLFGQREEERFIVPAITAARNSGIQIEGPLPPDAAFTSAQRNRFDAIVTLYHDQGHIPFKMLAFDTGVNITLGLPIIRTSVDHGTAFDIAWKGLADPQSLFAAISVAVELSQGKPASAPSHSRSTVNVAQP